MIKYTLGGLFGVFLVVLSQSSVLWSLPWDWNIGEWQSYNRMGALFLWVWGFGVGFSFTGLYNSTQESKKKQENK